MSTASKESWSNGERRLVREVTDRQIEVILQSLNVAFTTAILIRGDTDNGLGAELLELVTLFGALDEGAHEFRLSWTPLEYDPETVPRCTCDNCKDMKPRPRGPIIEE